MKAAALGFLLGVVTLQQFTGLPSAGFAWLLLPAIVLLSWQPHWRLPLALVCGFCWALLHAHAQLASGLDRALEKKDVVVTGEIVSLPEVRDYGTRFVFAVERLRFNGIVQASNPGKIRLNWYGEAPELAPGQHWRLTVRLKRPWGFMNPGGFDYEGWLYREGIRATGYVRSKDPFERLPDRGLGQPVDRLRQHLAEAITASLPASRNAGVIAALAVGERGAMEADQWELLLDTGTIHLWSISGLHIGMVAMLAYIVLLRLWLCSARLCLWQPAARAAALAGVAAGFGYSLLAGFSVPTQRSLIMLLVALGAALLSRNLRPGHALAVALLAVLAWDPFAVLSAGAWLSFAAVAMIVYIMSNRTAMQWRGWQWSRLQWALMIGLLPLTLLFFQRASLISPVANLLAVPWVGFVVVPCVLIGAVLLLILPGLGQLFLRFADWSLDGLWRVLELLANLPYAQWHHAPLEWTMIPALFGAALLLAPRGWPARWLGLTLFIPLALAVPQPPAPGAFRFTLLDVGQGLASVVETRNHVLVFDTGPRYSETFDTGEAVVVPYLRARGIRRIDTLIVSHGDNDHAGGTASVLAGLPVARILAGAPEEIAHPDVRPCAAGQYWNWDGVEFTMLHPAPGRLVAGNNGSCVLRVANSGGSVLLTADIEQLAENNLIQRAGKALDSDIVLAPHHGSDSSSGAAFIRAVTPELALVSAGYRNQWGFPKSAVIGRYADRGVPLLGTAEHGALIIEVHPQEGITVGEGYRPAARRYWNSAP